MSRARKGAIGLAVLAGLAVLVWFATRGRSGASAQLGAGGAGASSVGSTSAAAGASSTSGRVVVGTLPDGSPRYGTGNPTIDKRTSSAIADDWIAAGGTSKVAGAK